MNPNLEEDYDFEWHCYCCGQEDIKVKEDVNGECPNCKTKYTWQFDCNHDLDALWLPTFECPKESYQDREWYKTK